MRFIEPTGDLISELGHFLLTIYAADRQALEKLQEEAVEAQQQMEEAAQREREASAELEAAEKELQKLRSEQERLKDVEEKDAQEAQVSSQCDQCTTACERRILCQGLQGQQLFLRQSALYLLNYLCFVGHVVSEQITCSFSKGRTCLEVG